MTDNVNSYVNPAVYLGILHLVRTQNFPKN